MAGVYFLRKIEICDSTAMTLMTPKRDLLCSGQILMKSFML